MRQIETISDKASFYLMPHIIPAENWAGIFINAITSAIPGFLDKHSCEGATLSHDFAKISFMAIFAVRSVVVPIIAKAFSAYYPLSEKNKTKLSLSESEISDSLETIVFTTSLMRQYVGNNWITILIALLSTWPLETLLYANDNKDFRRGSLEKYKEQHSGLKLSYLTLRESIYNALSLASAASFLLAFGFNLFWDSAHEKSYVHQGAIQLAALIVFSLFGLASAFHRKIWHCLRGAESGTNTFFYTFMFTVSMWQCINPSVFTVAGFRHIGWIISVVVGAIILLPTLLSFLAGMKNPYDALDENNSTSSLPVTHQQGTSVVRNWFFSLCSELGGLLYLFRLCFFVGCLQTKKSCGDCCTGINRFFKNVSDNFASDDEGMSSLPELNEKTPLLN